MKKVYICSPCRGDYDNNIRRARRYSRAAVEAGYLPVTPHIYLTQFLDDRVAKERELGLEIGRELLLECGELWVFDYDRISEGMAAEILLAENKGIPIYAAAIASDDRLMLAPIYKRRESPKSRLVLSVDPAESRKVAVVNG